MINNDFELVQALLKHDEVVTREFFYKKCYPLFKSVYDNYHTDCSSCIEFINEIYIYLMVPRGRTDRSYLESFTFRCRFAHWLKIVAETYCRQLYKRKKDIIENSIDEGDRLLPDNDSLEINLGSLNAMDISTLLRLMPNDRYRDIIRLVYLEDRSFEETSALLQMSLDNFYNKHRLAKQQFLKILEGEQSQAIHRSRIPSSLT